MIGSEPTVTSFAPRALLAGDVDEPNEESEELLAALRCAYSATFLPWADMLGGAQFQAVTQELSMSEEAMVADESPYSTTYGLLLTTGGKKTKPETLNPKPQTPHPKPQTPSPSP